MMEDSLDTLLIAARAVHFAAASSLAGALCFRVFVSEPAIRRAGAQLTAGAVHVRNSIGRIVWLSFSFAAASGLLWFALLALQMSGGAAEDAFTGETLWLLVAGTQSGAAWAIRGALAALLAIALAVAPLNAPHTRSIAWRTPAFLALLLANAFLAGLVWNGHAGASRGPTGAVHAFYDALHLIASGVWLGGLAPLAIFLSRGRDAEATESWAVASILAANRFSILGQLAVGTLIATGAFNAWTLTRSIPALLGTTYGQILLLKIGLFLIMLAFASVNRSRWTPALKSYTDSPLAIKRLARNCRIEIALGLAILTAVGAFGVQLPGAHAQPDWPFPARYNAEVWGDPALWRSAVLALAEMALAAALLAAGLFGTRWRAPLALAGLAALIWFGPDLKALTVEAHATTFQTSPTRYTSQAVADGAALFSQQCASCHGANGEGIGETQDLTRHEAHKRLPGDRFWAISEGAGAGPGKTMPGFSSKLDATARWRLVDYLQALGDAAHLSGAGDAITPAAFRTPGFSADCPNGSNMALEDLRGRVIRLVMAGSAPVEQAADVDWATVILPLDGSARRSDACAVGDAKVTAAMAVYVGGQAVEGATLLVDAQGWLRFAWRPAAAGEQLDAATLKKRIEEIRRTPGRPAGGAAHRH